MIVTTMTMMMMMSVYYGPHIMLSTLDANLILRTMYFYIKNLSFRKNT